MSQINYGVRLATPADIAHLPAIEQAAAQRYHPYISTLGLILDQLENIVSIDFLNQAQCQNHLWVATLTTTQQPIGFVVVERLADSFFIVELDVAPEYGRQGIGSALMNQAIAEARQQCLTTVTLTTFRHVPWTIPFYRRLGFEIVAPSHYTPDIRAIVKHEEQYGFNRRVRVVMQCRISP
ncbi:MAG: GNAT family N-acetyltransferase [Cyanobacteria bacterium J06642_11]